MKFYSNSKFKLKTQTLIALMLILLYISIALGTKILSRNKLTNKHKSLKLETNSENYLEYFSNDESKFKGQLVYDFGLYGQYIAADKSNSTDTNSSVNNHTVIGEGDFGKIVYVKKMNDKSNAEYVIKIVENVEENVYRVMFRKSLALVMQHSIRTPKQTTKYFGVKTYMKQNKKSISILMDYIKAKTLFEVFRNPTNFLTNKQQIINLIYSILKAVNEFHSEYRRTHYDIKPQNFLIKDPNSNCQKAILINLEGSLTPAEEPHAPVRIITKFYTSPRFVNEKKIEQRFTDVYAAGVIILQTLANVVGVHMKYSEKYFHKTSEKYLEELTSKKAEMAKFLNDEEFHDFVSYGKSLLNHQPPKVIIDLIENKYMNFICRNN